MCEADPAIRAVRLTSEEEGIGLAAGAWLGGQRAALLMQSSGVGNCVNLLSLAKSCRFPLTMLVTMRGEWGEFNPWQVPMGTRTQAALELMDVLVYRIERAEEAGETVDRGARHRVQRRPRDRGVAVAAADRRQEVGEMSGSADASTGNDPRLDRRAAMRVLLDGRGDLLLVTGLGSTTYDAAAVADDARNFYLWGAMGAARWSGSVSRSRGPSAACWS